MLPLSTPGAFSQANEANLWATMLYQRSTALPWWRRLLRPGHDHRRQLPSLSQSGQQQRLAAQRDGGLQEVRLNQICGSEGDGRGRDFDDHFHPRNPTLRRRWLSVATAWYEGTGLPPVELIQVDDCFYIRDGYHRISVAGAAGSDTITAHVAVRELAGEVEPAAASLAEAS